MPQRTASRGAPSCCGSSHRSGSGTSGRAPAGITDRPGSTSQTTASSSPRSSSETDVNVTRVRPGSVAADSSSEGSVVGLTSDHPLLTPDTDELPQVDGGFGHARHPTSVRTPGAATRVMHGLVTRALALAARRISHRATSNASAVSRSAPRPRARSRTTTSTCSAPNRDLRCGASTTADAARRQARRVDGRWGHRGLSPRGLTCALARNPTDDQRPRGTSRVREVEKRCGTTTGVGRHNRIQPLRLNSPRDVVRGSKENPCRVHMEST